MALDHLDVLRVVLVDDHPRFRAGLARLLGRSRRIEVVGEAPTADLGVAQALDLRPDVVLMDIHMPGGTGIGAVRALADQAPDIPVLMMTVSDADADVAEAMLAGAAGYVLKGASASELAVALQAAVAGDTYLSPPVARRLIEFWRGREAARESDPAALLSPRELEVLRLVADGAENVEIAERLHISPHTVKRHVAAILVKLRAENRTQAAVWAVRQGLI